MERKNVLVPEADLAVQRDFQKKIKDMFAAREAHPVACVDTFGCQQNVADGVRLHPHGQADRGRLGHSEHLRRP